MAKPEHPMRVAIIVNSFPEISEKFLLNAAIGLMNAGVDVTVFAAHRSQDALAHPEYTASGLDARTVYLDIPRSMKQRLLQAPGKFFSLFAQNAGAALRALDIGRYRVFAKNLKLLWFGSAFTGRYFDVVHCHFGMNGLAGAYLKACRFCGSFLTTFHGSDINTYPSRHGADVYREVYRTANLVTVNTAFTGGKVAANGCSSALIRIHPVGLIPADYAAVDRTNVRPHSILTVGRLVEKKGHEFLLRAMPSILEQFPDTVWHIAGDGHLREPLERLSRELGIEGSVRFEGLCDADKVRSLYSQSAVFVLPSVTAPDGDMEGQGLVLQEAQCCGIPVVSTLHNGIPDGVLDGVSGFLVPEKDSPALAKKILYLFTHEADARKMGAEGRKFVCSRYDTAILAAEMKTWYQELTDRSSTS